MSGIYSDAPQGPLSASEAAGAALRLAVANYRTLVSAVSAVLVPTAVIGGVVLGYWRSSSTGHAGGSLASVSAVIGLVVVVLGNLLAQAVGVYAAITRAVGGDASWRHSLSVATARWRECLTVGLLVSIASGLALIAFIVPGVILYFSWFVVMPAVVVEQLTPRSAMARSWELTRGRRLSTLASYVMVELVILLCSLPLGLIAGAVFAGSSTRVVVAQQLATYLVQVLLTPLQVALVAVVYLDLRLRKELTSPHEVAREAGIVLSHLDAVSDHFPAVSSNSYPGPREWPANDDRPVTPPPEDRPSAAPVPEPGGTRGGTTWQVSPKPPEPRPRPQVDPAGAAPVPPPAVESPAEPSRSDDMGGTEGGETNQG